MAIHVPRLIVALLVLCSAETALACPQCALNTKAGLGSWFVLAGMILFPFFVVGGVLLLVRKLSLVETMATSTSVSSAEVDSQ